MAEAPMARGVLERSHLRICRMTVVRVKNAWGGTSSAQQALDGPEVRQVVAIGF